jgi:Domain of unknown function (DUF4333)
LTRPALLPLLGLAAALAAGGCGTKTVNTDKAAEEIEKGLTEQLNVKNVEVTCPDDVEAKKGDTFECTAKAQGESAKISVTQQDDDGNVRWKLEPGEQ